MWIDFRRDLALIKVQAAQLLFVEWIDACIDDR
jgi:hypothetical protein